MTTPRVFAAQPKVFRLLPREVQETRTFKNGYTYAVCPGCGLSMEREFVHYCSNCGQRLSWNGFDMLSTSEEE